MIQRVIQSDISPLCVGSTYRSMGSEEEHEATAITALGLRALRQAGKGHSRRAEAYLSFLDQAMGDDGAFAFWPDYARPAWALAIPDDTDDTALALTELFLAGRIDKRRCVEIVARRILPQRVRPSSDIGPAWIVNGTFQTWICAAEPAGSAAANKPNLVDCTACSNILALLAVLGIEGCPGWTATIATIAAGMEWAGGNRAKMRSLSPFYPQLFELRDAVSHAASCGVAPLIELVPILAKQAPDLPGPDQPICSGAYRDDGWYSPELHALRARRDMVLQ